MREAYMLASDDNALPANARQVMYAARPKILELTGKTSLDDQYFCQTLLPDYMNEHPRECADWNVVWSDRGHFTEPHTGKVVGLGTLAVREYVDAYQPPEFHESDISGAWIETIGPAGRYGGLLYVEKEGFDPLLEQAEIAAKYDIAIFSCKGMSVTAARELVDRTCARYKIPLFILHDFDISGFSIAKTLHSTTRRFEFGTRFKVHDMGLRLDDVRGLASEDKNKRRATLRANGATPEEIAFLMDDGNPRADRQHGKRVELNALTSRQFIGLIERKLTEAGVRKVIPPKNDLEAPIGCSCVVPASRKSLRRL
jgi:hypothetical protein